MKQYATYILLTLIIISVIILLGYIVKRFFDYREKSIGSRSRVIFRVLSIITVLLSIHFGLTDVIITSMVKYVQTEYGILTGFELGKNQNYDRLSTMILIGLLLFLFYFVNRAYVIRQKNTYIKESESSTKVPAPEIEFPENKYLRSPLFYERVKKIFEYKYEGDRIDLKYDKQLKILYTKYEQGLHKYAKVIFCKDSILANRLSRNEVTLIVENIELAINSKLNLDDVDVIDKYIIVENGGFIGVPEGYLCYTEEEFVNQMIDFNEYLKVLVDSFYSETLPFTSVYSDIKPTLSRTFVSPHFSIGRKRNEKKNLTSYIDNWLTSQTKEHIVILGDYGMGKSSFCKYYAAYLAENILNKRRVLRYPVLISLTNTSPRHGGIENSIAKFVAKYLKVSLDSFYELVYRGKILFILDGFDEMGFITTSKERIYQLNAIWKLALTNNKLLISGRPSYFPNDRELVRAFNLKEDYYAKMPVDDPYFQRLVLRRFNKDQIIESIEKYPNLKAESQKYLDFIFATQSIADLCTRPSMMHMVREMLPDIYEHYNKDTLTSSTLMRNYINHWVDRQLKKSITSVIEDRSSKKEFVLDFFRELATLFYLEGVEKVSVERISTLLRREVLKLNINTENEVQGIESEIFTGYFVEIDNDYFKFVHKSFKEFFVAEKIVELLRKNNLGHELLQNRQWTKEIVDFVYELQDFEIDDFSKKTPFLLRFSKENQRNIQYKIWYYKLRIKIIYRLSKLFNRLFKRPIAVVYSDYQKKRIIEPQLIKDLVIEFPGYKFVHGPRFPNSPRFENVIYERQDGTFYYLNRSKVEEIDVFSKAFYISILKNEFPAHEMKEIIWYLKKKFSKSINNTEIVFDILSTGHNTGYDVHAPTSHGA